MKEWLDKDIFDALRKGDREALSILFLRYYNALLHYGLRINGHRSLVEDSIQELFAYLFEASERLGNVQVVKVYLYKSFRRRLLKKIGDEKRLKTHEESQWHRSQITFTEEDFVVSYPPDILGGSSLSKALNALPWRQREAVYLRYYNRLSTREIADVMSAANQTVLNTLHQALKNLRKTTHPDNLIR